MQLLEVVETDTYNQQVTVEISGIQGIVKTRETEWVSASTDFQDGWKNNDIKMENGDVDRITVTGA